MSSPAVLVARSLGNASKLRHSHAGGVPLTNSGARGAVDTFHRAPLQRALPIHEPALGVEAAEPFGERKIVLVVPLDRDVQRLDDGCH